jgi:hypothetical protein
VIADNLNQINFLGASFAHGFVQVGAFFSTAKQALPGSVEAIFLVCCQAQSAQGNHATKRAWFGSQAPNV